MKQFEAKTVEEAVEKACQELGVTPEYLTYEVVEEKKSLFSKKAIISCYTEEMINEYVETYIRKIISDLGFQIETVVYKQEDRIYVNMNTDNNSILIGKAGNVLRAINFLVKKAASNEFKKRIEVSVDINGYKEKRYSKMTALAHKVGKQVLRTKHEVKLDPIPADERKVIHQVIANMDKHLKTQSHGEGKGRYMVISYVD